MLPSDPGTTYVTGYLIRDEAGKWKLEYEYDNSKLTNYDRTLKPGQSFVIPEGFDSMTRATPDGKFKIREIHTDKVSVSIPIPTPEVNGLFDDVFIREIRPTFQRKGYLNGKALVHSPARIQANPNRELTFETDGAKILSVISQLEDHPSKAIPELGDHVIVDFKSPTAPKIMRMETPVGRRYQVMARGDSHHRQHLYSVVALRELPHGKVEIAPVWPARRALYMGPETEIPTWNIDRTELMLDKNNEAFITSETVVAELALRQRFGNSTGTIKAADLQKEPVFEQLFEKDELPIELQKLKARELFRTEGIVPFAGLKIKVTAKRLIPTVQIDRNKGEVRIALHGNQLARLGPLAPQDVIRKGGLDSLPGVWIESNEKRAGGVTELKHYPREGDFFIPGRKLVLYLTPEGSTNPLAPLFAAEDGEHGLKFENPVSVDDLLRAWKAWNPAIDPCGLSQVRPSQKK
ncbi:MAG: hypothetical protein HY537_04565 [Deltaproteobacteria bacterium]|nr:hypothetical protein [Deltaproteobacteria bacterium]